MSQLEPPSDRVILKPHDPEQMTAGGIVLPEIAQGKSQYATVLAVGEGSPDQAHPDERIALGMHVLNRYDVPAAPPLAGYMHVENYAYLKPGDVVILPAYNGTEIDWPGEGTVISILASELLAVVSA